MFEFVFAFFRLFISQHTGVIVFHIRFAFTRLDQSKDLIGALVLYLCNTVTVTIFYTLDRLNVDCNEIWGDTFIFVHVIRVTRLVWVVFRFQ